MGVKLDYINCLDINFYKEQQENFYDVQLDIN